MNKLIATTLTCALTASAYAEDVDRKIDAAADGHVEVSNISGSIIVNGWSRDEVAVTGSLGRNVEELILERDGKDILVKVKVPKRDLRKPQNHKVEVSFATARRVGQPGP